MKSQYKAFGLAMALALASASLTVASENDSAGHQQDDRQTLLELDARLARSQIVERDPAFFSQVALEDFRVLAPGGMFENKAKVIAGLPAWNVTDIQLSGTEVVLHGDVALVMGRLDIDGTMAPVGRWGPLKYISTWVREDSEWRLLSRSLTPCLDKLIEMGRC